jgi:adenylate cyclase
MRHHGATQSDRNNIVKESQIRIKRALVEGFEYHHLAIAKSDSFLRKHTSQRMSTELAPDFLSKIVTVFSQEASYIIEHFGGLLLKFVGDASIGYFPSSQNLDDIVICGQSIVHIVRNAINPLLLQMGHAGIEVKVTSDYGQHTIVRYGSDQERSHVDIISATMNLAAKMQSVAVASQMVIGKSLYDKLGEDLQQIFAKANLDQIKWNYHNLAEKKPYQLYIAAF